MATTTIDNLTWSRVKASPSKALKVRLYNLARPARAFLAVELMLLAFAVLRTVWDREALGAFVLMASCTLFFHVNNVDRSLLSAEASRFWIDLAESVSLGMWVSAGLFSVFPRLVPPVGATSAAALVFGLLPVMFRMFLPHLITRGRCVEQILIVGTGDLAAKFYRQLDGGVGWPDLDPQMPSVPRSSADRVGTVEFTDLNDLVLRNRISRVVVTDLDALNRERLAAALLDSRLRGLQVSDAVDFYERIRGKIWVEALNPQWFVYTNGFICSRAGLCLKRCFDVMFAAAMILLASPLLVLIAIAIKSDSAGPVLFRQVRVGLHGRKFVIYKFRSMRRDAELDSGPAWAAEQDARVTRVGRLLRTFRLDEIPQAFNVLKGDMSIVGPRPERPCFVDRLKRQIPFYDLRHYLKPGITGWAQVMYQYGSSVEDSYEKLQYDLYYAKHRSFRCDVEILLRTVRIVLFGRGR
ncbi:putative Sugar transferase, PEP-CTERM system associated [Candidatus Sulfopaludibacter sp. SbA4]|nr:putative Sugar transferase, PEP-CTERM system associated [Candidatus Sulfopaludibacter sp. SbA4]